MRHIPLKILLVITLFSQFQTVFSQQSGESSLLLQSSEVHNLMIQLEADRGSLSRFYFVRNSPERRERFRKFYQEYSQKIQALIPQPGNPAALSYGRRY